MQHTINVIIDRFEHDKAILITPFGQQIIWPREALPEEAEIGTTHKLGLDLPEKKSPITPIHPAPSHSSESDEKRELVIAMLEEILNPNEPHIDPQTQKKLL